MPGLGLERFIRQYPILKKFAVLVGRQGWGILVYSRDQLRSTGWGEGGHRKGPGDREATDVGVGLSEGLNPQVRWKG